MPIFAYQARDRDGQRVTGTHEATDGPTALAELRAKALVVTKIAPVGALRVTSETPPALQTAPQTSPAASVVATAPIIREMPPRVEVPTAREMPAPPPRREEAQVPPAVPTAHIEARSVPSAPGHVATQPLLLADAKQLSLFFRQMHAMLNAGSSVAQALNLMAKNAPNAALCHAAGEMSLRAARGEEWNVAMRAYPGLFSELMVGMISAGEHGGFLDRICARLADYSERDYEIQQTIKRETWYPKMVFALSFIIPSVVPLVLGGFGAWFDSMKGVIFFALFAFIGWKVFSKVSPGTLSRGPHRLAIDEAKLKFPVAGKFVRALATAKFCRALGALQAAGMGLHKTVMLASDACGNEAIARRTRAIIHRLDNGATLTSALEASGAFPPLALQMLATGEASGSIETQLDKVADFLESDAETAIKQATAALGVAALLFVGIKVGFQLVGFYGGYFQGIEAAAGGDGP